MANPGIVSIALVSVGVLHTGVAWAQVQPANEDEQDTSVLANETSTGAASAETTTPEVLPTAGYDGAFYVSDGGVNRLEIGGRVQGRFEFLSVDRGDADRFNQHAFLVPRARLQLSGQTLTKRLQYEFQADFGKGQVALKDYYVDYNAGKGSLKIRGGQFKKPFSRQQLTSSGRLEFVDRTIVDAHFDNGRDLGLMVHNGYAQSPTLEWAFGVFNGTGDSGEFVPEFDPVTMEVVGGGFSNVPVKMRPAVVGRIGHNSSGMRGYTEADLEGGDLRFAIAAAVMTHFQYGAGQASTRAGADFAVKQEGISATGGVYADLQGPTVDDLSYAGIGAYTQVGYVLDGGYQPALRYAVIAEDGGNNSQELSGVFSLYEFAHRFKWQTDVSLLTADDGSVKTRDVRGRSQIQVVF